jgi:hypothetical protein
VPAVGGLVELGVAIAAAIYNSHTDEHDRPRDLAFGSPGEINT